MYCTEINVFLYRAGAPEEGGRWEVGKQFNIGFCPLALHQLPVVDTLHKLAQSYRLAQCYILAHPYIHSTGTGTYSPPSLTLALAPLK